MSLAELYTYRATVIKVYDGDTITVDIDLGFGIVIKKQSVRLLGIDAPELRGEERQQGLASRSFVVDRIPIGSVITLKTVKDKKEKYGRYLATIYYGDTLVNLNEEIVASGNAKIYE
jgi:micrococcal nuclease